MDHVCSVSITRDPLGSARYESGACRGIRLHVILVQIARIPTSWPFCLRLMDASAAAETSTPDAPSCITTFPVRRHADGSQISQGTRASLRKWLEIGPAATKGCAHIPSALEVTSSPSRAVRQKGTSAARDRVRRDPLGIRRYASFALRMVRRAWVTDGQARSCGRHTSR